MLENPRPIERGVRQENLIISPQTLFTDNHSPKADEARARFNETRAKREISAWIRCADARVKTAGDSISIGNISAASLPNESIASHRSLESLIAITHIDGGTIEAEKMPTGCGGLAAKADIGDRECEDGIEKYVSEKISSKDPVAQALRTAERLAYLSADKPVLAATQNHLNYDIYPIAYFQVVRGQLVSVSSVKPEDIINYNPERIYKDGFPTIEEGMLPDVLKKIIEQNRSEAQDIFAKYPDLTSLQKVQNPRMIFLSTDIRSARVRYPELSSVPGSIFKVHVEREKLEDGVSVKETNILDALSQLQYPIEHYAIKNYDDQTKPFSRTDRLVVETGDIELSRTIANEALKKSWMKKWITLPDRKILLVQTNAGVSNVIEEL